MFDSPLAFCKECQQWVALDQKRTECAARQKCQVPAAECPLREYFTGAGGLDSTASGKAGAKSSIGAEDAPDDANNLSRQMEPATQQIAH